MSYNYIYHSAQKISLGWGDEAKDMLSVFHGADIIVVLPLMRRPWIVWPCWRMNWQVPALSGM